MKTFGGMVAGAEETKYDRLGILQTEESLQPRCGGCDTAMGRSRRIAPGLIISLAIALAAMWAGGRLPGLGAGTVAVLAGILFGNAGLGRVDSLSAGTRFAESTLLYTAIVLLGGTVSFHALAGLGWQGALFIIILIIGTIGAAVWLGRLFGLQEDFRLLMAAGSAVCGSAAIGAAAPAIRADERDKGAAVAMVNVSGTVLMLMLPALSHLIYKDSVLPSAALIGGVLQSAGQVIAAGSIAGESIKEQAAIFKILRILCLAAVLLVLIKMKSADGETGERPKTSFAPWYIVGFFALCSIHTWLGIPPFIGDGIERAGSLLELTALAAIGMRIRLRDLLSNGLKMSLYTICLAGVQIAAAIVLIRFLLY